MGSQAESGSNGPLLDGVVTGLIMGGVSDILEVRRISSDTAIACPGSLAMKSVIFASTLARSGKFVNRNVV